MFMLIIFTKTKKNEYMLWSVDNYQVSLGAAGCAPSLVVFGLITLKDFDSTCVARADNSPSSSAFSEVVNLWQKNNGYKLVITTKSESCNVVHQRIAIYQMHMCKYILVVWQQILR